MLNIFMKRDGQRVFKELALISKVCGPRAISYSTCSSFVLGFTCVIMFKALRAITAA
jgi:hypothetical protein